MIRGYRLHRSHLPGDVVASPAPKASLPGPDDILRRVLPNGIIVLARENWSAPSVVVEGYLLAGNLDEPAGLPGLASFVAGMLSRGTTRHTFAEISETIEGLGASIGFGPDRQAISFSTKSLAEDLDTVLGLLAEELRMPAFPTEYIERVRGMRLTALAERENDTRQMAGRAFRELMYGKHPLGRDMLGTRESLAAIQRESLVGFYEQFFRPQGMVVAVVGALKAEEAVRRVEEAFGDWSGQRPARPALDPLRPLTGVRRRHVVMADKSQSDIIMGWHGLRRLDEEYDAARLANTVLGVFGMMGRLGANVRERQGMAYYAYSHMSGDRERGTWLAIAGVNPANVQRAQAAMLDEIRRLQDELVPEDELQDSKRFLVGSLPLQLETNDGVASLLVDLEWHQLGLDYLWRYEHLIEGVTAAQVQAVSRRYLDPTRYIVAIAGPETEG